MTAARKGNLKKRFWNWGPKTIWCNMTSIHFERQISLHPTAGQAYEIETLAGALHTV